MTYTKRSPIPFSSRLLKIVRFGMYAGPNFAGGEVLGDSIPPPPAAWNVAPVSFVDAVTRNHDINYTWLEKVYGPLDDTTGTRTAAEQRIVNQAYWQADKEMLINLMSYRPEPNDFVNAFFVDLAIKGFAYKNHGRAGIDVDADWASTLARFNQNYPAPPIRGIVSNPLASAAALSAATIYQNTGMMALTQGGLNIQQALLFNSHIRVGQTLRKQVEPSYMDGGAPNETHDDKIVLFRQDPNDTRRYFSDPVWIAGKTEKMVLFLNEGRLTTKAFTREVYEGNRLIEKHTARSVDGTEDRYGQSDLAWTKEVFAPDGSTTTSSFVTARPPSPNVRTSALTDQITPQVTNEAGFNLTAQQAQDARNAQAGSLTGTDPGLAPELLLEAKRPLADAPGFFEQVYSDGTRLLSDAKGNNLGVVAADASITWLQAGEVFSVPLLGSAGWVLTVDAITGLRGVTDPEGKTWFSFPDGVAVEAASNSLGIDASGRRNIIGIDGSVHWIAKNAANEPESYHDLSLGGAFGETPALATKSVTTSIVKADGQCESATRVSVGDTTFSHTTSTVDADGNLIVTERRNLAGKTLVVEYRDDPDTLELAPSRVISVDGQAPSASEAGILLRDFKKSITVSAQLGGLGTTDTGLAQTLANLGQPLAQSAGEGGGFNPSELAIHARNQALKSAWSEALAASNDTVADIVKVGDTVEVIGTSGARYRVIEGGTGDNPTWQKIVPKDSSHAEVLASDGSRTVIAAGSAGVLAASGAGTETLAAPRAAGDRIERYVGSATQPHSVLNTTVDGAGLLVATVTTTQNGKSLVVQYRENEYGDLIADKVVSLDGQPPVDDRAYIAHLKQQGITPFDLAANIPGAKALPAVNADGPSRPMTPSEVLSTFNPAKSDPLAKLATDLGTLTDIMSLVKAIQSGQPVPMVASGLRVVVDYQRLTQDGNVDPNLAAASNIAGGLLSLKNLSAALDRDDALGAVSASANIVNYTNLALDSWGSAGLKEFLNGTQATATTDATAGALSYLNLAMSIRDGDAMGTAINALAIMNPAVGIPLATAYSFFNMLASLFGGGNDEPEIVYVPAPMMWGEARYTWNNGIMVPSSLGNYGGDAKVVGALSSLTDHLKAKVDSYNYLNPDFLVGLIAQRLPVLAWSDGRMDGAGWKLTDIDPLTAQERQPDLRYDDNFRPYTAVAGSREQYWSLGERFVNVALERGAIAAKWEVDTARMQANHGMAKAGLAEEEWAAKKGIAPAAMDASATSQVFRPITLDLDGSGRIERGADVSFNADDSGYLKRSDWITAQDGFLFLDRNLNGRVDGGKEIFSNSAVGDDARGLSALEWTDADGNGVINALDPVFAQLRVWQDANGNGIEDPTLTNGVVTGHPELKTLAELGITSLNYRAATFTRNGEYEAMLSQRLSADTAGSVLVPVADGLKVLASDGTSSLIVTQVADNSQVTPLADRIGSVEEDIAFRVSTASLLANDQLGGSAGSALAIDMSAFGGKGVGAASHGTVTLDANGYVLFTPDRDYHGAAGFSYGVVSPSGQRAVGVVSFDVAPVNDDPVAWVEFDNNRNSAADGNAYVSGRIRYFDIDDPTSSVRVMLTGLAQMGNVTLAAPSIEQNTGGGPISFGSVAFTYANRT